MKRFSIMAGVVLTLLGVFTAIFAMGAGVNDVKKDVGYNRKNIERVECKSDKMRDEWREDQKAVSRDIADIKKILMGQ